MLKFQFYLLYALLFILTTVSPQGYARAQPVLVGAAQADVSALIAEVNALRASNGLPAYTANSILTQIAQDQANYMAATGQIAHRSGLTQRLLDAGYPLAGDLSLGGFRAENITGGSNKTAAQAVQEWMGDSLHMNTMLSANLTEIGAGVARVGNMVYLVIDCACPTTDGISQDYTPAPGDSVEEFYSPGDLIVPVVTSAPDEDGRVYHEVQSGQTLWAIAIAHGVKIDEIRALNGLGEGTEIYQGDRLLVREDAPPPSSTATSAQTAPLEVTQTAIPTLVFPALTPPMLPTVTATSAQEAPAQAGSKAGIVVGAVLVALLLAGYLTWIGGQKPA